MAVLKGTRVCADIGVETWSSESYLGFLKQSSTRPPCRCYRRRHLRGFDCPGDNRQIPIPEEGHVPEPGSKGSEAGGQPRLSFQQPGRLPEPRLWKPKGVFHLTRWPDGYPEPSLGGRECPDAPQGFAVHLRATRTRLWQTRLCSMWKANMNSSVFSFRHFTGNCKYTPKTGNDVGLCRCTRFCICKYMKM